MAYLQPPLTIISSNESHKQQRSRSHHRPDETQTFRLPAATWFDEDQNHFVALEERISSTADNASVTGGGGIDGGGSLISGLESLITTNTNDTKESDDEEEDFEIVRYQAFGLPYNHNNHHSDQKKKPGHRHHRSGSSSSSSEDGIALDVSERINNLSAFESAAKKVAKANKMKSLVTEIAVTFTLPASLANIVTKGDEASSAGDDDTTAMLTRRIPILAKFSPMVNGLRYLALQYTPT
jgi:hypothetical protein